MNRRESTADPRAVGYLMFVSLPVMGEVTTSVVRSSVLECRGTWCVMWCCRWPMAAGGWKPCAIDASRRAMEVASSVVILKRNLFVVDSGGQWWTVHAVDR